MGDVFHSPPCYSVSAIKLHNWYSEELHEYWADSLAVANRIASDLMDDNHVVSIERY